MTKNPWQIISQPHALDAKLSEDQKARMTLCLLLRARCLAGQTAFAGRLPRGGDGDGDCGSADAAAEAEQRSKEPYLRPLPFIRVAQCNVWDT